MSRRDQSSFRSIHKSFDDAAASGQVSELLAPSKSRLPLEHCFVARHAIQVAQNGYSCFPLPPGQKKTHWRGWSEFCSDAPTAERLARWQLRYSTSGIAIACGWKTVAADIDALDPARAADLELCARRLLGDTPLMRFGQYPKRLLLYRVAPGLVIPSQSVAQVDLIGDSRYFVGFGIHPKTKAPYWWVDGCPATVPLTQLPTVTHNQTARFLAEVTS